MGKHCGLGPHYVHYELFKNLKNLNYLNVYWLTKWLDNYQGNVICEIKMSRIDKQF